jgi:hypothetical protein
MAPVLDRDGSIFVCFFILHTAGLRPWHIYNGLPPPGRGQLVRPPRDGSNWAAIKPGVLVSDDL